MNETKYNDPVTKKLILSIAANALFSCFEYFMGMLLGSLSLIADSLQNFTDTCSLSICLFGHLVGKKKPSSKKTYGYGRAPLIAALCNSIILLCVALYIFKETYERFYNPEPLAGGSVMLIGFMGIILNGSIALLFKNHRSNINIKSAFVNIIFDAIASAAAIIAGFSAYITNTSFADTFLGGLIGCMLCISAFRLIKETFHILLDGVPHSLNITDIERTIRLIPAVHDIHDLHVWSPAPQHIALSCQITMYCTKLDESVVIISTIKKQLKDEFAIHHATIEPQCTDQIGKSCAIIHEKH